MWGGRASKSYATTNLGETAKNFLPIFRLAFGVPPARPASAGGRVSFADRSDDPAGDRSAELPDELAGAGVGSVAYDHDAAANVSAVHACVSDSPFLTTKARRHEGKFYNPPFVSSRLRGSIQ